MAIDKNLLITGTMIVIVFFFQVWSVLCAGNAERMIIDHFKGLVSTTTSHVACFADQRDAALGLYVLTEKGGTASHWVATALEA